jgi:tryptophanyl-tRNA synthetase
MDLINPTIKMSKSNQNENGTIFLDDKPALAIKKIMSAKTDSLNKVHFDFTKQPGISNLMTIFSCLTDTPLTSIEDQYKDKSYGEFKKDLAEIVNKFLVSFQTKHKQFATEINKILKTLNTNAIKCNKIANAKLDLIYKTIGMRK